MLTVRERNSLIKKALIREFGNKNVRVRGSRGTAYGWVHIYITAKKPHTGDCGEHYCFECSQEKTRIETEIYKILKKESLFQELGAYYDDMGHARTECTIHIELREDVELAKKPAENNTVEIGEEGYKVVHDRDWTWIYFINKPEEKVREKLKENGFRFSKKRLAWYKTKKVEITL